MAQTSSDNKRFNSYGPGGLRCPCCGPAPKHRAKYRRLARRRAKRAMRREEW